MEIFHKYYPLSFIIYHRRTIFRSSSRACSREKRPGRSLSKAGMHATLLRGTARLSNSMHSIILNNIDPDCMVCGRLFPTIFLIIPPRPSLLIIPDTEFLERKFFTEMVLQKSLSAYFSPDYYTAPGLSLHFFHQITTTPDSRRTCPKLIKIVCSVMSMSCIFRLMNI